ncbi:endonuclease/exonuclease/phosphatase family protein [Asticcacaulis sp. YBE204]|uniref:endonuclease/exonuclease/phosphatase family protein n=1 Tax=Asticcacaulis sp. YBE204 TaxID=1282363 RepID=UPI0003C3E030|nr:endonuclease/exonuclease/phosphatase family protein [Asticcacaulis sp. YBE204]ESQ77957.1 hypothetical protein AEYBE204_15795 [Asticcacaulis sp. YBE204]
MRQILTGILGLGLVYTILAFLGGQYWAFDLLTPFRPQALLAGVLLLPLALLARRKLPIGLATAIILLNALPIGVRLAAFPAVTRGEMVSVVFQPYTRVDLLSANVLTSNRNFQTLRRVITSSPPDVLVLTEVDQGWLDGLSLDTLKHVDTNLSEQERGDADPEALQYPYRHEAPRRDNFGMAIYATAPFTAQTVLVGDLQLPLMRVEFDDYVLLAAHPIPPISGRYNLENRLYLQTLADLAQNSPKPIIIAGDLNATLWSASLKPLTGKGLNRVSTPLGWAYSWPVHMPPLAIQIDHIFAKDIVYGELEVLKDIGSDHFPVRADIVVSRAK